MGRIGQSYSSYESHSSYRRRYCGGLLVCCGSMFRTVLCGSMRPAVLCGLTGAAADGWTVRTVVAAGVMKRAELCGSMFRTVLVELFGTGVTGATGGATLGLSGCCAGCGVVAADVATADAEVVAILGSGAGSPSGSETCPFPRARVSFVITGVFAAFRFVRFASATSGESSADAMAAPAKAIRSIALRIYPW